MCVLRFFELVVCRSREDSKEEHYPGPSRWIVIIFTRVEGREISIEGREISSGRLDCITVQYSSTSTSYHSSARKLEYDTVRVPGYCTVPGYRVNR